MSFKEILAETEHTEQQKRMSMQKKGNIGSEKKLETDEELRRYVIAQIIDRQWSSEQISGETNEKQEFGHWESDATICEYRTEALSVQYERSTQRCYLTKVANKGAEATERAWRNLIEDMSVKSLTMDRGGVENLNGLIRQYLPRGIDLSQISHQQIYVIQERLNNRPRKGLSFKSPNERLKELRARGVVH